jgi:RNA polymerase sigma-70 factor, ECF subfamily
MGEFDAIYEAHLAAVFRYTLKCVGRRDVAEDITSDVFLALHHKLPSLEAGEIRGWLFTVAKNKAVDHWRRAQLERRYLETLPSPEVALKPTVESWLHDTKALNNVHRACLILRYVHGMDRAAIARRLGLTPNQVKGHLQYGLTILRRELQKAP